MFSSRLYRLRSRLFDATMLAIRTRGADHYHEFAGELWRRWTLWAVCNA